jgi:hypothetical protein
LHEDDEIAQAVSYFYAVRIISASMARKQPVTPEGDAAVELANQFGFWLPSTYDICGSSDGVACVVAIDAYAREFAQSSISHSGNKHVEHQ